MGTFVDYLIDQNEDFWVQLGIQKGERALFIHQLKYKFELKKIPEKYRQQIEKANSQQLFKWAEKVLESQSLKETFVN